jgi:hypothetical protein
MTLGVVLFYPHVRRMIMFPLSLFILAFSGLEDILYYWLDGRVIPAMLPWLNKNPLIVHPISRTNLLLSASLWLCMVVLLEILGVYLDRQGRQENGSDNRRRKVTLARILPKVIIWFSNHRPGAIE